MSMTVLPVEQKEFDCVEMKRQIQAEHRRETGE
jgi:hypothetical protein